MYALLWLPLSGLAHDPTAAARERLVADTIEARGLTDADVLRAMHVVPRHLFMPPEARALAYVDSPVSIGHEQTISQPYIVALMTDLADVQPGERVLEIGTGSGYQAAVLAEVGADVYTIEIVAPLAASARVALDATGYRRVHTRVGDGYAGWPEQAPFQAIVVTAAPAEVPQPLLDQLAVGGRLVIPVGTHAQDLLVITRTATGYDRKTAAPVRFVPMTGEAEKSGR